LFWGEQPGGGFHPASILGTYPNKVGDWSVRSDFDEDDINYGVDELVESMWVERGDIDGRVVFWNYGGWKVSLNRQGRRELVDVLTHREAARSNPFGWFGNALNRTSNPEDAQQVRGPNR